MQQFSLIIIGLLFTAQVYAQQEKKPLLNDKFKGNIAVSGDDDYANTTLSLQHVYGADMGRFTLDEVYPGNKFSKPAHITTEGDWTVLKGSATNENATVVELDAKGGKRVLYFLRLKNGNLQQLDLSLHELPPASKHILRKQ